MERVMVQPPDSRGLREVSIGGKTVGSVWSLRELRDLLSRHGYPKDMNLEDRASICWRESGSDNWPDRPWRRRTTVAFMMAGLFGSTVLLVVVGYPDAFGALTFAGRVTGFLFVLAGAVEGVAAFAALDYWGKRQSRFSGALVLLGVLISLTTNSLLLFLWLEEREYTRYLLTYLPLWCWSLWAVWVVFCVKVWREIPHPKKIAAGVTATALLAALNLSYSAVYQPTAVPDLFSLKVKYGVPRMDVERPIIHLPVTLRIVNTGKVPAYILSDTWSVYGRTAKYFEDGRELRDRTGAMESLDGDVALYFGLPAWKTIGTGPFYGPGAWLEPGEEYAEEKVIQLSKTAKYDVISAELEVVVMRKDRGKVDMVEFATPRYSWNKDSGPFYCPPSECWEHVTYHARVRHNNNMINVTRRPRYVTATWGVATDASFTSAFVGTFKGKGEPSAEEDKREQDRYGVSSIDAEATIPFAALLNPPRN